MNSIYKYGAIFLQGICWFCVLGLEHNKFLEKYDFGEVLLYALFISTVFIYIFRYQVIKPNVEVEPRKVLKFIVITSALLAVILLIFPDSEDPMENKLVRLYMMELVLIGAIIILDPFKWWKRYVGRD